MDYLFQHEADPLPDPNAPQTSQPSAAIDADDDEDLDPLGNIDAEAKVLAALPWCPTRLLTVLPRASNVPSAGRYSETRR